MVLEHLYRISLEESKFWALFIGLPANSTRTLDVRIDQLSSYIRGLLESCRLSGTTPDYDAFFYWLRDERLEFSTEGWETKYLNDCEGDHLRAIGKFWGLLHEYLLVERPDWFVRLNLEPLPSQIRNGAGVPHRPDIRNADQVRALR